MIGELIFGLILFFQPKPWFYGKFYKIDCPLIGRCNKEVRIFFLCVGYVIIIRSLFLICFLNVLLLDKFGLGFSKYFLQWLFLLLRI